MAQETLQINIKADNRSGLAGVQQTIQSLDKLDTSAKKASVAMAGADAAVKKSQSTYQNLGRVIQDLPFGFQGIQNNLTQLIPSVGALGLAFSALVSAITFSQVGFTAWGAKTKAAKEEADKLNKSIAEETVSFQTLYRVATNANAPLEARKQAISDLRDQYGNYLKNFSDEEIMAGKATSAYNSLTDAILKVARAKAAQEQITALFTKRLAEEAKLANISAKAEKQAADNAARRAQRGDASIRDIEMGRGIESAAVTFARASQEALKVANSIGEIDKEINRLNNSIDQNTVKPLADNFKKSAVEAKSFSEELKRIIANTVLFKGDKRLQFTLGVGGGRDNVTPRAPSEVGIKKSDLGFNDGAKDAEKYKNELQGIYDLSNQLGNSFVNTIAAGQSLGQALVQVFADIAKAIAAAIAKALIFKLITGLINPGGAGISSAFSIGDLFKGFLGFGPKPFADGGIVNKPTLGVFGEAGSEAIMPLSKLNGMLQTAAQLGSGNGSQMSGEFRVQGTDLVLVLQRAGYSLSLRR